MSDILKDLCERLFNHHKESASVCGGLEKVDKSAGPEHRPDHIHNRDLYERMSQDRKTERIIHFPKILKDALLLKRNEKVLEKRKRALKVYKALKDAGAKIGWGIEGY